MKSGIYQFKNKINGKVYIGSSQNLKRRLQEHIVKLNKNEHESAYLQNAWNKYSSENFEITILEEVNIQNLIDREQYWIDSANSADDKFGYNIYPQAGSPRGYKWSKEAKEKLSQQRKGRIPWNKGKKGILTPEGLKAKQEKMRGNDHKKGN